MAAQSTGAAPSGSGGADSAGGIGSVAGQLMCQKCDDPTTMTTSQPAGSRNPLLRNCTECNATIQWKKRMFAVLKPAKDGKEHCKEKVKQAKQLKDLLDKMTKDAEKAWFKEEKAKRQLEGNNSKRTFSDTKGYVNHESAQDNIEDDLVHWEPFEQFAIRVIALGRCKNEKEAVPLWKEACKAPGARVAKKKGVLCLAHWKGVETRGRDRETCATGYKSSQAIENRDDLETTKVHMAEQSDRFSKIRRMNDMQFGVLESSIEPGPLAEAEIDVVMSGRLMPETSAGSQLVSRELAKKQQAEELMERDFQLQCEQAAENQVQQQQRQQAAPKQKVKAVEQLNLKSHTSKLQAALEDVCRKMSEGTDTVENWALTVQNSDDTKHLNNFKKDSTEKVKEARDAITAMRKKVDEMTAKWVKFGGEDHTADEYFNQIAVCTNESKTFLSKADEKTTAKDAVDALRAFKVECEKAIKKASAERAKQLAKASKATGAPGATSVAPSQPQLAKVFKDAFDQGKFANGINVNWAVSDVYKGELRACMVPGDRCKAIADAIRKLDYYASQKGWVEQAMKKSAQEYASAVVVKMGIVKKIEAQLCHFGDKQLFGNSLLDGDESVQGFFRPQFYRGKENGFFVAHSTDYDLVDARMLLEGEEVIAGIRANALAGVTAKEKSEQLCALSLESIVKLITEKGFAFHMKPNMMCVIPNGFAVIYLNCSTTEVLHGLRWQMHGGKKNVEATLSTLEPMVQSSPELATTDVGKM
ncbi:unnamed protein product, partial [Prorocentrum cordatum]